MAKRKDFEHLEYVSHIMDSVADGVFTVDSNMRIMAYNRAAELITGIPREKAVGKPCHEVFRTAVCSNRCPVREAIEKGKPVLNREVTIQNCQDEPVPVSVSASILYDGAGNPIGGVETIRSLRRIYAIMDSVPDGLFTVDEGMLITHFNRACEEITGVRHDEAIGRPCYEIFHTEVCRGACPMVEAIATGQPIQREVEITDRAGRKKLISVSCSTLYDCAGKVMGGIETVRDLTPISSMREELRDKYTFRSLVSRNPVMRRLFDVMEDVAASDATVFLHGESGTGKELFARAIHELSPRRNGPLVTVNCGALPETLLESEIFGVRKGAFTGATENRPGRLELCQGGTFFLDEVGDLPLPLQVKL
jgi:PAS domain S-box-containing protein